MVETQLKSQGISDPRVLKVMGEIPRHQFVDEALAGRAYSDATLPIGEGQTLSQPYTVARMTEALGLTGREEVLEIGTGSGYQTAVLSRLCRRVYTIERLPKLAENAKRRLTEMGMTNIVFRVGDGSLGWPMKRQFDRILVTAGAPVIPENLTRQLQDGGTLMVPEGGLSGQLLVKIKGGRSPSQIIREELEACCFVPLVGKAGWEGVS
ncbi:MAG: protein-L-isoaspartate(D-aspartate) O-methyltransferase [Magnetococcales bacterium]|nr:protein-L-isoaspartate(D-aspartate) O-methyltransferase [Magnetococcales bacterium]